MVIRFLIFLVFCAQSVSHATLMEYNQGSWGGCIPVSYAQALFKLTHVEYSPFDFMMRYKTSRSKGFVGEPFENFSQKFSGALLPEFLSEMKKAQLGCTFEQAIPWIEFKNQSNNYNDPWGFNWTVWSKAQKFKTVGDFAQWYIERRKKICRSILPKVVTRNFALDRSHLISPTDKLLKFESIRSRLFDASSSQKLIVFCKQTLADEKFVGTQNQSMRSNCDLHVALVNYVSQISGKYYVQLESTWGKQCNGLQHCDVKSGHYWLSEEQLKNNLVFYSELSIADRTHSTAHSTGHQ